jgi:hypothetical protein
MSKQQQVCKMHPRKYCYREHPDMYTCEECLLWQVNSQLVHLNKYLHK